MTDPLARLREPARLRALATLAVDHLAAQPVAELLPPHQVGERVAEALAELAGSEPARAHLVREIDRALRPLIADSSPLRDHVPAPYLEPVRAALQQPLAMDRDLVARLLDQHAIRSLVREVLETTLMRFARRLRSMEPGKLGGVGRRALKRGRGLLGGVRDNLGVAGALVDVVRDEVEQSVERRVKGFVVQATRDALANIADHVADPAHSEAHAQLRLGTLEVLLDTPGRVAASAVEELDVARIVDAFADAVLQAHQAGELSGAATRAAQWALAPSEGQSLADHLSDLGATRWRGNAVDLLAAALGQAVHADGFEGWWEQLFS